MAPINARLSRSLGSIGESLRQLRPGAAQAR
jgi:hypothetical protein